MSIGARARTLFTVAALLGAAMATVVGAIDQAPVAQGVPTPTADYVTASINRGRCYATNEHVPVRIHRLKPDSDALVSSLDTASVTAHATSRGNATAALLAPSAAGGTHGFSVRKVSISGTAPSGRETATTSVFLLGTPSTCRGLNSR